MCKTLFNTTLAPAAPGGAPRYYPIQNCRFVPIQNRPITEPLWLIWVRLRDGRRRVLFTKGEEEGRAQKEGAPNRPQAIVCTGGDTPVKNEDAFGVRSKRGITTKARANITPDQLSLRRHPPGLERTLQKKDGSNVFVWGPGADIS